MNKEEKIEWLQEEIEFCNNRIKEINEYGMRKGLAEKELERLTQDHDKN